MRLFKKKYLEELRKTKENVSTHDSVPQVNEMKAKARGRPLLLGQFDNDVQMYIKALRKAGTPVSIPVVIAAAEGIITARKKSTLLKYGGHIQLG